MNGTKANDENGAEPTKYNIVQRLIGNNVQCTKGCTGHKGQ